MPIYILQALNTETCLTCLWWQAWWFVTKTLRATWTLSWNIQTKAIGNFEKDTLFQSFSNNLYKTHLISSNQKRDVHSKMTPPFFFKVILIDATHLHGIPQQVWLPLSERHSMQHWLVEDEGLKSLLCHTCCRTWVSWYIPKGVG